MPNLLEDIKEFELIFKEYYNPLVNFINRYLNNLENSKEVVQITFSRIWENRANLNIKTSFKNYLYQSAKNNMIDYIRKNKYILNAVELEDSVAINFPDNQPEHLDPYIIKQAVENVLKEIKPKAKEIFSLHKFEGLTYEEISEYLKISKRSVEDNVAKILKHLKHELKNHPDLFDNFVVVVILYVY